MKLACLGEGSNSYRVALRLARRGGDSGIELSPYRTMDEVFAALVSEQVDRAVVPVRNSLTGKIDYLSDVRGFRLRRVSTHSLKINHCIATKGYNGVGDIGFIVSHKEALKQCRVYLEENFVLNIPQHEMPSTAEAARFVSEVLSNNAAAIADPETCRKYGLKIIREDIVKGNYSTFWVVER